MAKSISLSTNHTSYIYKKKRYANKTKKKKEKNKHHSRKKNSNKRKKAQIGNKHKQMLGHLDQYLINMTKLNYLQ